MNWFGRRDREYREELDSHIEMEVRENLERGMAPETARQAALRTFGKALAVRERLQEGPPSICGTSCCGTFDTALDY